MPFDTDVSAVRDFQLVQVEPENALTDQLAERPLTNNASVRLDS